MSCHRIESPDGKITGWVCLKNIYEYKGHIFEFHDYLGPHPLRKDLAPRKRIPKGFWDIATEFAHLTKEEKEKYLIYG